MSTLAQVGRGLRIGLGLGLVTALALASGCVSGGSSDESEDPGDAPTGEAAEAQHRSAPVGIYRCTLGLGLLTGSLVVYPGPLGHSTCTIFAPELAGSSKLFCSGSPPFMTCPDCQDLRSYFACPYR